LSQLERALPGASASRGGSYDDDLSRSLPVTISQMHDFFVHLAARSAELHEQVRIASKCPGWPLLQKH
jgi:hypothetical protein